MLIMVPALLVGFDVIPQSAEEIDLPAARIGLLLIISVFLAVAWYSLVSLSVAVSMPAADLAASSMATGDAASALWGHPAAGTLLVLGGVAGGILTSRNAFVIGGFVLALALIAAYLPGSPSALIWPYEWLTITIWSIVGVLLFLRYRLKHPGPQKRHSSGAGAKRGKTGNPEG